VGAGGRMASKCNIQSFLKKFCLFTRIPTKVKAGGLNDRGVRGFFRSKKMLLGFLKDTKIINNELLSTPGSIGKSRPIISVQESGNATTWAK
jgi:hypothetical protein